MKRYNPMEGYLEKNLAKLNKHLYYHTAISLLGICPGDIQAKYEKTYVQGITTLFLIGV